MTRSRFADLIVYDEAERLPSPAMRRGHALHQALELTFVLKQSLKLISHQTRLDAIRRRSHRICLDRKGSTHI